MTSKVAVVTGGNKGIGYAIVQGLCKQLKGYDVILTARDESRGKAAVAELTKAGANPTFFPLDINNVETIEKLKQHLQSTYGGLDILVNNAGIAFKQAATETFAEQARVTVATNFTGTIDVCNGLFSLLRPGARVVHVSSRVSMMSLGNCTEDMRKKFYNMDKMDDIVKEMASFVDKAQTGKHQEAGYSNSSYGMSKVGVTVMTGMQQAAIDKEMGGKDILVNSCCPGYVSTDMSSHKGRLTVEQGADTPIYLATLPAGTTEPKGQFCADRKVMDWRDASIKIRF